jgi:2,3-diaminopropionate biosynthesis protein SbnA
VTRTDGEPPCGAAAQISHGLSQRMLDRLAMAEHVLRPTPVVRLDDDRIELFTKLEFLNAIGSVKDRPAFWILKNAVKRGEVSPATTIIESSSGNFAHALAVFSRMLGLRFTAVVDPNVSPVMESLLRGHGAEIVKVTEPDSAYGFLRTRLRAVNGLLAGNSESYWPNQYSNLDGLHAHYSMTGTEIIEAVPDLDYAFIGVSSAATIAGVSRRLKEHNPRLKIVAVDVEGSIIFGQSPKTRTIPGLGSSVRPPLLDEALIDEIVVVSESEMIKGCHAMLERHGLFVGGSSGAAYAAIQQYFSNLHRLSRPRTLFLSCDSGAAYLHNIYNMKDTARCANADHMSIDGNV